MIIFQQGLTSENMPYRFFKTNLIEFPLHWHDDYEFIYNLEDKLHMALGDQDYVLEKDDILIAEPLKVHAFLSQNILSNRMIVQLHSSLVERFNQYENLKIKTPVIKSNDMIIGEDIEIYKPGIHQKMKDAFYSIEKDIDPLKMMRIAYDLLSIIYSELETESYADGEKHQCQKRILKLESVIEYINQNYAKKIDLDLIASIAGYSPYHFTKFFKSMTGMTFKKYLNSLRIERACVNLLKTNESITEICYNSGFTNLKTFNRVFKSYKACSPTEYRNAINEASKSTNDEPDCD